MSDTSGKHTQGYYDDFSDWYERDRHHGYHAMVDRIETGIASEFAWGRDVLEVGCGTGLILQRVAKGARKAVGVDLSRGMIQGAMKRGLVVGAAGAEALPFRDESFDVAYSFKVLAHVPDITAALKELCRVTRPGGHLLLEFYNPWSLRYLAKRLGGPGRISSDRKEDEVYTRWDTVSQVKALLPPEIELLEWRGVRIFTPAAFVHRIPLVRNVLEKAECWASRSPLAKAAGFTIAVCRKR